MIELNNELKDLNNEIVKENEIRWKRLISQIKARKRMYKINKIWK